MEDSVLSTYLPLLGDRIAVRQFSRECNRQANRQQSASGNSRKHFLLETLKHKLKRSRTTADEQSSSDGDADETCRAQRTERKVLPKNIGNQHARKLNRTICVGWLNNINGHLVQVRSSKGGGTRNLRVPVTAKKTDILAEIQKLFFPAGVSDLGNQSDFAFNLVDVRREVVEENATVASLYEKTRTAGNLRFSMTTTRHAETVVSLSC